MTVSPARPATGAAVALLIGLAAAASYAGLASPDLGFQGAYYDELHQAVPAFAWIGRPSHLFSTCRVAGIPVMVMKYKAATEAALYGPLWLATGHPFTLESWRAFGIGTVALGILAFAFLARWSLRWWALGLVLLLLVLDSTVVLGTRLNWGPVALGLFERLLLVGVFLRGAHRSPGSAGTAFLLGAIVGFAAFDKLSWAGLALPVALWIVFDDGGNRVRRILAAIGGGLAGSLPLLLINARWWLAYGTQFSLREVHGTHEHTVQSLLRVISGCLTLGSGHGFAEEILGEGPEQWVIVLEGAALAVALAASMRWLRGPRDARGAGLLALSWLATVGWLYSLPETTHHHHWPMTVPFALVAPVLALQAIAVTPAPRPRGAGFAAAALAASIAGLLAARIPATIRVQEGLREHRVTAKWDPGLNALGRFAESRPEGTGFVAAGWGVATQIFAFSQGRPDFVDEIFWDYRGRGQLAAMLDAWRTRDAVYLVALDPPQGPHADVSDRIFADAAAIAGWREAPVEPELRAIACIRSKKLVRAR